MTTISRTYSSVSKFFCEGIHSKALSRDMDKFEFRGNVLVGMGRIGWRDLRLEKGALLGDNSSCSSARS